MRKSTKQTVTDRHQDWLSQVETAGPFLALPVIKDIWPEGVDRLGDTDDRAVRFKQAFAQWQRELDTYELATKTEETRQRYAEVNRAWIDTILDLAGWDNDLRVEAEDVEIRSPGEQVRIRPSGALEGKGSETYAALLLISEPTTSLRAPGLDGWSAHEIDRMAMLLRKAQVECGIVTDGQWWAVVWAKEGKPTGSGMVNALTWAEEPLLRDAFLTLIDQKRFRAKNEEQRLPHLFARSELEAEEITEALGTQVRRSVELLVQAFSEARLEAKRNYDPDPLTENPDQIYQAAVTIMMRVVFLLFAEEREMLPTEELYWDSYALRDLLSRLEAQAAGGEEHLDESYDAWHRLLAVSQALHGGVNYDEMRMPAYGGSLLDPTRFPWLHTADARGLRLKVSDRVMLHVLKSVQTVVVKGELRRISFRDIDVEQIGYIYEGLLGYSCSDVAELSGGMLLGLIGKEGAEPEIPLGVLEDLYEQSADSRSFAAKLIDWVKKNQPAATPKSAAVILKAVDKEPTADEQAELVRLLTPVSAGDPSLLESLVSWGALIRRDLRNIPMVIPIGGLAVVETPSRKNAGAHYTPRSLAEEVVLHALQPLVYSPGPLQTNDESAWRLKSSTDILDLKVADIAAGSGAFLVAAARYSADRLTEAWQAESLYSADTDPADIRSDALREVIARCLYGADINPMAVEMCKLSLWLVSMDRSKPFSFVDDKIFCGNSLLGLTSEDQLEYLHLYPDPARMDHQIFVDVRRKLDEAARLRRELANPVNEQNAMRSTRGKERLLAQSREVTRQLRQMADGIIAAGLPLGGKPGNKLNDAYKVLSWEVQQAFPPDGAKPDGAELYWRIEQGLKPTVETDYERWEPLHWVVEVPDVMVDNGGFDAIVGNPPFLGVKLIRGAIGQDMRNFLSNTVASGETGRADYVIYFLLQAARLGRGTMGMLATDSIGEGDSSRFSLALMARDGWKIRRAERSTRWPTGSAGVRISKLWMGMDSGSPSFLDGRPVLGITSSLTEVGASGDAFDPVKLGRPVPLPHGYQGTIVLGKSLVLSSDEAERLRSGPLGNSIAAYMSGDDLVGTVGPVASRYVLDVGHLSESQLRSDPAIWTHLQTLVWPERMTQFAKYPKLKRTWWGFLNRVEDLYRDADGLEEVVAFSKHSKHLWPVMVSAAHVFSNGLVVYPTDNHANYAFLASEFHRCWSISLGGSMLNTAHRYNPSRMRSTYPFPDDLSSLNLCGARLNRVISESMLERQSGITDLLNRVHDPALRDSDLEEIREEMVMLNLKVSMVHGFQEKFGDLRFSGSSDGIRFGLPTDSQQELVAELVGLNRDLAEEGGRI